ncbi:MAG: dolichyl-phosphate beta-glucosyltransferase [Bryobacteraceae bacterium]
MNSISIVIPAFNEENRLPATLRDVFGYLSDSRPEFAEVIVVDDGSTDLTCAIVERLVPLYSGLRLLKNPGNRGKGYSVRHGVMEARGEWVLFTDADLSAPIDELDKLLEAATTGGAAVAIGSRALDRSLIKVHQSVFRENAGRLFNLLVRLVTGLGFQDTQCGFKLFEAGAAREIFRRQRLERFGFDVEVLFIARLLGYKSVEVPVRWSHSEGTKVRMLRDSLAMFGDVVRVRWNQLRGCYK